MSRVLNFEIEDTNPKAPQENEIRTELDNWTTYRKYILCNSFSWHRCFILSASSEIGVRAIVSTAVIFIVVVVVVLLYVTVVLDYASNLLRWIFNTSTIHAIYKPVPFLRVRLNTVYSQWQQEKKTYTAYLKLIGSSCCVFQREVLNRRQTH